MVEPRKLTAPNILLIDLEASSLYQARLSIDDPQQPWAVSCAAALCTPAGEMVNHFSLVIKAEGRTIKEPALAVHGITARAAAQIGVPESRMLGLLSDMLKTAPLDSYIRVVSFSDFDSKVLSSLFARFAVSQGKPSNAYDRLWMSRPLVEFIDLQKPWCQQACKLPSEVEFSSDYRWPSLDDAREIILGRPRREGFHDAFDDLLTLKDLFFHFVMQGHFKET